jgi:hypothetical protein
MDLQQGSGPPFWMAFQLSVVNVSFFWDNRRDNVFLFGVSSEYFFVATTFRFRQPQSGFFVIIFK